MAYLNGKACKCWLFKMFAAVKGAFITVRSSTPRSNRDIVIIALADVHFLFGFRWRKAWECCSTEDNAVKVTGALRSNYHSGHTWSLQGIIQSRAESEMMPWIQTLKNDPVINCYAYCKPSLFALLANYLIFCAALPIKFPQLHLLFENFSP